MVEEGFGDPGYRIRAEAHPEEPSSSSISDGVLIEVVTKRLDGDFIPTQWARTYRLTISSIPSGTYALRLHWQNDFQLPEFRSRILVDTVITVP
jgi:hypothetical protein